MKIIVSGRSMEPAFHDGDKAVVNRIIYKLTSPKVGDVVVLRDPRESRYILKRVTSIVDRKIFVEGDNPDESTDSRSFGLVSKKDIVGRVNPNGRF